ncbi:hypothetical protein D3C76_1845680 [compost metagenome]
MVVSPSDTNGSNGWKMERLSELAEAIDEDNGQIVYIYTLDTGVQYTSGCSLEIPDLLIERIIFTNKH